MTSGIGVEGETRGRASPVCIRTSTRWSCLPRRPPRRSPAPPSSVKPPGSTKPTPSKGQGAADRHHGGGGGGGGEVERAAVALGRDVEHGGGRLRERGLLV